MRASAVFLATVALFVGVDSAQARHRDHQKHPPQIAEKHHHYRYAARHHLHYARRSHRDLGETVAVSGGLVTVPTAAGISITVAASLADKFQGLVADLVASGYRPRHIGCFARGGHVAHSRHYAGAACDFDQTGWGRTAAPMRHVASLAAKWGLRDGCSFGDCGHVDDGQVLSGHRYASLRRHRYGG